MMTRPLVKPGISRWEFVISFQMRIFAEFGSGPFSKASRNCWVHCSDDDSEVDCLASQIMTVENSGELGGPPYDKSESNSANRQQQTI
ncbi:hypothetical protein TNCV_2930161 [Trichonephila clavipes]|nr:hypothetical protein TNCV_2930161 [Trichonephila clavipes]